MPRYFVTYKKVEGDGVVLCKDILGWFQNKDMAAMHAHYLFTEPGVSIVDVVAESEYRMGNAGAVGRVFIRVLRIAVAGCLVFYMYNNFLEFSFDVFDVPLARITADKIFSVFLENWIGLLGLILAWVVAFGRRAGR